MLQECSWIGRTRIKQYFASLGANNGTMNQKIKNHAHKISYLRWVMIDKGTIWMVWIDVIFNLEYKSERTMEGMNLRMI